MKIRKANKKNERHMVRRFGVEHVRAVLADPRIPLFDENFFVVTYYYGKGYGPTVLIQVRINAVDEMDAYKRVMDMLRNKQVTTRKAKRREDFREYNRAVKAKKNGADAWHKAMMEYLTGFKNTVGTRLMVG